MTLLTMTIPDEPAELARWLERRLMAPDFGQFIAELAAHFPASPTTHQPHHLLDRWLPMVLEEGLALVPSKVLGELLRSPAVLAAFQEQIAMHGGAYWDELPEASDELSSRLKRGKRALARLLSADSVASVDQAVPKSVSKGVSIPEAKRTGGRGYRVWAIVSTGVAACLAVSVFLLSNREPDGTQRLPKAQIAWGWAKPGGLAVDQSLPKDYLNTLASNLEEWSLHRPGDADGLATRIAEFRLGCTRLMHSTYGALSPQDKAWLLGQCREWAKSLDRHQQALDAGIDPIAVRAEVDEMVRVMAATLREKAKEVG
jgi:hypothetical protein